MLHKSTSILFLFFALTHKYIAIKKWGLVLFLVLGTQCLYAQDNEITVNGIKHTFKGTVIYDHRVDKGELGTLEFARDSIIYHKMAWWGDGDVTRKGPMLYIRTSLAVKGAQKMKSFEIKSYTVGAHSHYLLTIVLKKNVLKVKGYFDGMPSFANTKKTYLEMVFDSEENALNFVDTYFKRK